MHMDILFGKSLFFFSVFFLIYTKHNLKKPMEGGDYLLPIFRSDAEWKIGRKLTQWWGVSCQEWTLKQKTHYCVRKSDIYTLSHVPKFSSPSVWSMIYSKLYIYTYTHTCIKCCITPHLLAPPKKWCSLCFFDPLFSPRLTVFLSSNRVSQWIQLCTLFYPPYQKHTTLEAYRISIATIIRKIMSLAFVVLAWCYRKCSFSDKFVNLTLLVTPHFK